MYRQKQRWVSNWVISAQHQVSNHGNNKLFFDEMMSAMYLIRHWNTLSWIFVVPDHWHASLQVDTLSWIRPNQSVLLNAACLADPTNTKFIVFDLIRPGLETMIYHFHWMNIKQCAIYGDYSWFCIFIVHPVIRVRVKPVKF